MDWADRMALEALGDATGSTDERKRVAAALREEREACAAIADQGAYYSPAGEAEDTARTIAKLIRART